MVVGWRDPIGRGGRRCPLLLLLLSLVGYGWVLGWRGSVSGSSTRSGSFSVGSESSLVGRLPEYNQIPASKSVKCLALAIVSQLTRKVESERTMRMTYW